ncbi:MAG: undecaprenyl-diphosphatase UppP [Candidatus Kapaibacterium sp.]|nr:MAG: undecaprenyl-diphosphatase UppP [Candidatus Kapabacteria bacterium]
MTIVEAIILGLVQGLTEFLPVSSSAHLTLAGKLMGLISPEHPETWTSWIAVMQLGTLLAVLLYFAQDIHRIGQAFFTENLARTSFHAQSQDSKFGWYVIIGTLPIVIFGLLFKNAIESALTKDATLIAGALIVFALILEAAERLGKRTRTAADVTWRDAVWMGLAQALALFPGASRSGTTITAGLFCGLQREVAARFSFLLSIPAVFASGMLQLRTVLGSSATFQGSDILTLGVATLVAGVSGYASIAFLLKFLQTRTTTIFVVYRIMLGIGILTFFKHFFA